MGRQIEKKKKISQWTCDRILTMDFFNGILWLK